MPISCGLVAYRHQTERYITSSHVHYLAHYTKKIFFEENDHIST